MAVMCRYNILITTLRIELLLTSGACRGSLYGMLHSPTLELTWAHVAAMCCGAARGMQHLHNHSVLHRDLKSGKSLSCFPAHTPAWELLPRHAWIFAQIVILCTAIDEGYREGKDRGLPVQGISW